MSSVKAGKKLLKLELKKNERRWAFLPTCKFLDLSEVC